VRGPSPRRTIAGPLTRDYYTRNPRLQTAHPALPPVIWW